MVNIIGAGLAGVEAAHYLANQGIRVNLYEMRPNKMTPAHQTGYLAELVCSNSLRSDTLQNAVGILKREMAMFDSLVIKSARLNGVPAGSSLAVDRTQFSSYIESQILLNSNIKLIREEISKIDLNKITIIAAGPLASESLSQSIRELFNESDLHFYDAIAPIIDVNTINREVVYLKNRYDKEIPSYLNCPMTQEEYDKFYDFLINAPTVPLKDFETDVFEGCMPVEVMAKRGRETLLFGPLKPVGLEVDNKRSHAVVQLRQDDLGGEMFNMVGFQTNLTFGAQAEMLKFIPGLEKSIITRYGIMHRNTYLESPKHLNANYQSIKYPNLYFAGQICGVEGYVESAASGLHVGIAILNRIKYNRNIEFPTETIMGAMARYISTAAKTFVPMNANFGLLTELGFKHKKRDRKELYAKRALDLMTEFKDSLMKTPLEKDV